MKNTLDLTIKNRLIYRRGSIRYLEESLSYRLNLRKDEVVNREQHYLICTVLTFIHSKL